MAGEPPHSPASAPFPSLPSRHLEGLELPVVTGSGTTVVGPGVPTLCDAGAVILAFCSPPDRPVCASSASYWTLLAGQPPLPLHRRWPPDRPRRLWLLPPWPDPMLLQPLLLAGRRLLWAGLPWLLPAGRPPQLLHTW
ncbi:hypothetical protein GUJ93_ZPchr0009g1893 [Zizania palustris]|uniref:Uncharacterized protein n=1 Tax=Zizania palustris TaxID=103762 RepID=A0A8J5V5N0_ZIZPA|nr:hypothetical protein GUJ93_ZPchr0009g1893 [Zizania palustris]